jgi:hypothetical protein
MLRIDTRFPKAKTKKVNRLFFEKMTAAKEKTATHFSEQPTPTMLKQPTTTKQAGNNPKSNPTNNENRCTKKHYKERKDLAGVQM